VLNFSTGPRQYDSPWRPVFFAPPMPSRRHVHTRSIRIDAYVRDDGLWDLEAELTDTKSRDFPLATGMRKAGDPVHRMVLTVTIDTKHNVLAAHAESPWVPYPGHCDSIGPDYAKLVGLNLLQDFRKHVQARLGGVRGCSHLTELAKILPTAAVQAFAGEVFKTRDAAYEAHHQDDTKPWQLDRCHALRTDGPAVARFYPRWYHSREQAAANDLPPPTPIKDGTTR
jgi:hypothetical protein